MSRVKKRRHSRLQFSSNGYLCTLTTRQTFWTLSITEKESRASKRMEFKYEDCDPSSMLGALRGKEIKGVIEVLMQIPHETF